MNKNLKQITAFILATWLVYGLSQVYPLQALGIRPRQVFGLVGIPLAPLLHGSWHHLFTNTYALFSFAPLVALVEGRRATTSFIILYFLSGAITWIIGRESIHIGASGLIFGLYGHLLGLGLFKRQFFYLLLSSMLLITYGTMLFGVLPTNGPISWEGHLAGLLSGLFLSKRS